MFAGRICFRIAAANTPAPLEGVNRAADLYAGLFAASGTSRAGGHRSQRRRRTLSDYASLQNYLESLTFISHVSVESLSGDTVRFRLSTRGGADSLQHALSLNGRLQPVAAGENGIQRFQLHH